MIDRESMQSTLRAALVVLAHEHAELFDFGVSERGLVHHLAVALRPMIPSEFDVDVEYNREARMGQMKRDVDGGGVTPDLLIHQRGVVDRHGNILVLEAKKVTGDQDDDAAKIVDLMTQFEYCHGVTLAFGTRGQPFAPHWSWWEVASPSEGGPRSGPGAIARTVADEPVFTSDEARTLFEEGVRIADARHASRREGR